MSDTSASSASIGPSASQVCSPLHHQQVAPLKEVDKAMLAAMRGYAKSIMANEYRDVSNFDSMEAQRREEFFKRIKKAFPYHLITEKDWKNIIQNVKKSIRSRDLS